MVRFGFFFEINFETPCIFRGNFELGQSICCRYFASLIESLKKLGGVKNLLCTEAPPTCQPIDITVPLLLGEEPALSHEALAID